MTCTHQTLTRIGRYWRCPECNGAFTLMSTLDPKDRCALGLRGAFDCACQKCEKEKGEPPWTDKERWEEELNGRGMCEVCQKTYCQLATPCDRPADSPCSCDCHKKPEPSKGTYTREEIDAYLYQYVAGNRYRDEHEENFKRELLDILCLNGDFASSIHNRLESLRQSL